MLLLQKYKAGIFTSLICLVALVPLVKPELTEFQPKKARSTKPVSANRSCQRH